MKVRVLSVVVAALLAGPMSANATLVSWLFQGQLDSATGSAIGSISAGQSFSAVLHFDTATPANNNPFNQNNCFPTNGGPGSTCRHNGALPTVQYWSDITINGFNYGTVPEPGGPISEYLNSIIVRNNATDPDVGDTVDGYSFTSTRCYGPCDGAGFDIDRIGVIIRGPEDLNLVTDALLLPENPSPSMSSLRARQWSVCSGVTDADGVNDCQYVGLTGNFNSVRRIPNAVPEPGTLALLSLAGAGLAALRRRRPRD